jgi:antitoxin (DNA-binding transcriptional repressor) of toxin-antitoxin stability system
MLDLLEQGEEVLIERHGRPVARLVRADAVKKPQLGGMRGEFSWEEGWDRPFTDEETRAFWEGRW